MTSGTLIRAACPWSTSVQDSLLHWDRSTNGVLERDRRRVSGTFISFMLTLEGVQKITILVTRVLVVSRAPNTTIVALVQIFVVLRVIQ